MRKVEIEIKIPLNGKDPVEHIEGINGMECTTINDLLFNGMGTVGSEELTEEAFLQAQDNPQFINAQGG